MKTYTKVGQLNITQPTSVALGTFDGVHKGHRAVIEASVNSGYFPVVFSINRPFHDAHPSALKLSTDSIRSQIFEGLSVEVLAEISFEEIYKLTPAEFVDNILIEKLNTKHISCGFNFRFGKGASGDVSTLTKLCEKRGIKLTVCDPVIHNELPISSSRIRTAVEQGEIETAIEMLGHFFTYDFVVEDGDRLGRKLGAPTINQYFPVDFTTPKFGVYAAVVNIDGKNYIGVCNIGVRPTVNGTKPRSETYILDYSGNLYGKNIPVSPVKYLRPEMKFDGLSALKNAIFEDAKKSEKIILERNVL